MNQPELLAVLQHLKDASLRLSRAANSMEDCMRHSGEADAYGTVIQLLTIADADAGGVSKAVANAQPRNVVTTVGTDFTLPGANLSRNQYVASVLDMHRRCVTNAYEALLTKWPLSGFEEGIDVMDYVPAAAFLDYPQSPEDTCTYPELLFDAVPTVGSTT